MILTAVYAVAEVVRQHAGQAAALAPVRDWAHGWHRHALAVARMFVLVSPVAVPAGLALAAALWAWRNYAISAGIGGRMASAPVTFDNRQWKRQVSAATGRTAAPGNVPLLTRKGTIPVGGTIRDGRLPVAAGLHPPRRPPACGTWSSSARPGRARPIS